jgi:hypothetical protein
VIFDTGSTDLWLPSTECTTAACESQNRFDSTSSSTFVDLYTQIAAEFGSGDLFGTLGQDTITLGDLIVPEQVFAEIATEIGSWTSADDPFDGLAGLAFPALSDTQGRSPLFDNIIDRGLLSTNSVSFYFGPYDEEDSAVITFGEPDSDLYTGTIQYIAVQEPLYWQTVLSDILVNGESTGVCDTISCIAIFDTGTTLLTGPTSGVMTILTAIGALEDCSNYDSLPSITYVFEDSNGTYEFDLEPYYYMIEEEFENQQGTQDLCAPAFMTFDFSSTKSYWIVGDIFMRKYFTVYNRGTSTTAQAYVGLATGAL